MPPEKKSCFVATIDLKLAERLKQDLIDQGFELKVPIYTLFSAQKPGISCTLYTSGKLTVQGKGSEEFILFYLEPEILQTLSYSHPTKANETAVDTTSRIGIDEAGKGDFFGPLCVAGVQADEKMIRELIAIGVRDSKTMTDPAMFKLSIQIKKICPHAIVRISPKKYNALYKQFHNLNHLLAWGHATAIGELVERTGCTNAIIDKFGGEHLVINALKQKSLNVNLTQKHGAESDPVVAAASILARTGFVEGLEQLEKVYGMRLPKGASRQVIEAGRKFVAIHGTPLLEEVAKLHFKTTQQVLE